MCLNLAIITITPIVKLIALVVLGLALAMIIVISITVHLVKKRNRNRNKVKSLNSSASASGLLATKKPENNIQVSNNANIKKADAEKIKSESLKSSGENLNKAKKVDDKQENLISNTANIKKADAEKGKSESSKVGGENLNKAKKVDDKQENLVLKSANVKKASVKKSVILAPKTEEEWVEEERDNSEKEEDAGEYFAFEIAKEGKLKERANGARLKALQFLLKEADEQERQEEERLALLKQERKNAEQKAKEQKTTVISVVNKEIKIEKEENRRQILLMLQKELQQEKMDKAVEAEDNEPTNEEIDEAKKRAEQKRLEYLNAKRNGTAVIKNIGFKLSREDILDFMAKAADKFTTYTKADNKAFDENFDESKRDKYPIKPSVNARKSRRGMDSLRCGVWCFSLLYERKDTIKLIARIDDEYAQNLIDNHTGVKRSLFPSGENWYSIVIDGSYDSKKEVFSILYHSYLFVLKKYYELVDDIYITDENAGLTESKTVDYDVKANENAVDDEFEDAIKENIAAEMAYLAQPSALDMTRRRILNYVVATQGKDAEILERERALSPTTLKIKGKTYAMVYQGKRFVRMILKLHDDYADILSIFHPLIRRAKFPQGANWYIIEVDSSYTTVRQVYSILTKARNFVDDSIIKTSKAKTQKQ